MQPLYFSPFVNGLCLTASSLLCVCSCELILAEGQEAEDVFIATELRLEYGDGLWLSLEFDQLVVTSRLLLDRVGELLQPPVFFVDDLSAFALEDANELCDRFLYLSFRRMKTVS